MNERALILSIGLTIVFQGGVYGGMASGGGFILDSSLLTAVQQTATDGNGLALAASIGEGISHVSGNNHSLKAPDMRIFDGFLGPAGTDPSAAATLTLNGGNFQLVIPAGALPQSYEVMVELDPLNHPIKADPAAILQANQDLPSRLGAAVGPPSDMIEVRFLLSDGTLFSHPTAVPFLFREAYAAGENEVALVRQLNEASKFWEAVSGNESAQTGSPAVFSPAAAGVFALVEEAAGSVSAPFAFPVPWRPNASDFARYGTLQNGITFANVASAGQIRIFNTAGELVRDIPVPSGSGQIQWDGKTDSGSDAASGVYIWSVESGESRKTGKLMIIR